MSRKLEELLEATAPRCPHGARYWHGTETSCAGTFLRCPCCQQMYCSVSGQDTACPPCRYGGEGEFALDGLTETYQAVSFGAPWNGWATPVVTYETAKAFADNITVALADVPVEDRDVFTWDGDHLVVTRQGEEGENRLAPNGEGLYFLGDLGYVFYRVPWGS